MEQRFNLVATEVLDERALGALGYRSSSRSRLVRRVIDRTGGTTPTPRRNWSTFDSERA